MFGFFRNTLDKLLQLTHYLAKPNEPIPFKRYYSNGKLCEVGTYAPNGTKKKIGPFVRYHKNGKPYQKGSFASNGSECLVGDYEEYWYQGTLSEKCHYADDGSGKRVGLFETHYPNECIMSRGTRALNGSECLVGDYETYWSTNQLSEKCHYADDGSGLKDGLWQGFDMNGRLIDQCIYKRGKKVQPFEWQLHKNDTTLVVKDLVISDQTKDLKNSKNMGVLSENKQQLKVNNAILNESFSSLVLRVMANEKRR